MAQAPAKAGYPPKKRLTKQHDLLRQALKHPESMRRTPGYALLALSLPRTTD
jgi:hypothetical protein